MKTWIECVSEAKGLIKNMKSDRLKVARLALLATKLPGTDMSVSRFAREIAVTPQTLNNWILAYEDYRKTHPVKEPEAKDYAPAAKNVRAQEAARPKAQDGRSIKTVIHISIKTKAFLSDVNRLKERLKLKGEVKAIDSGVRTELVVKLREIADMLEKAN